MSSTPPTAPPTLAEAVAHWRETLPSGTMARQRFQQQLNEIGQLIASVDPRAAEFIGRGLAVAQVAGQQVDRDAAMAALLHPPVLDDGNAGPVEAGAEA